MTRAARVHTVIVVQENRIYRNRLVEAHLWLNNLRREDRAFINRLTTFIASGRGSQELLTTRARSNSQRSR